MKKYALAAAALLAGAGSLIYELVWTRYLSLILGGSIYAVGVVTACYMAGMAAGSFLLGRWLDKRSRAVTALIFGGFGLVCALSPALYRAVGALSGLLPGGGIWPRAAISFAALFVPTFFIGGMIPALVRGSKNAGRIYAMNTLGSVLGAAAGGFLLIRYLGLSYSGLAAGLLAAAAGAILLAAGRTLPDPAPEYSSRKPAPGAERVYESPVKIAAVCVYALSGFTAMAFQVYQTRILTLFFMDSVYDFTIILTVFLIGLAIGNALSSRFAAWEVDHAIWFSVSQVVLGICTILCLYAVSRMPYMTQDIYSVSVLSQTYGDGARLVQTTLKVCYAALILLVPAVLWGSAFPLVSRIARHGTRQDGKTAGSIIGWNTVGSALGSILGGFVLISLFGLKGAVILGGVINLAGGLLLYFIRRTRRHRRIYAALTAAAVLAAVFLPRWDRFEMSTSFLVPGQDVQGSADILFYNEDETGITSVVNFLPYDQKYLTTNRLYCQNTSGLDGPEDHRRLGVMPLLLHGAPRDVLVAGLGAGITLRGAAEYGAAQIDCVEISHAVVEAAGYFAEENGNVLARENVSVMVDDARHFVASSAKHYDVIIADIFFPMSSGSSSLFCREYYEDCKGLLNSGGLMAQWLPLHQLSAEELDIIIATFSGVFEHTYLWFGLLGQSVPVVGLIGTREALSLSLSGLARQYSDKGAPDHMALDDEYMLLSHFIGKVAPGAYGAVINTDDRPVLEFLNPLVSMPYHARGAANLQTLLEGKDSAAPYVRDMDDTQRAILEQYEEEIRTFILQYCIS